MQSRTSCSMRTVSSGVELSEEDDEVSGDIDYFVLSVNRVC